MNKGTKPIDDLYDYIRPSNTLVVTEPLGFCDACGGFGPFEYAPIITDKLAREWGLSNEEQHAFSSRESMFCSFCRCSYRLRALARAICLYVSPDQPNVSLKQLIEKGVFKDLRVAEINSCGVLHDILKELPHLAYSEYGSKDPKIPNENVLNLSYKDKMFDLVLSSDTFEHVPDVTQGLKETNRILRKGGAHILTVPARMNKLTKKRVVLDEEGNPRQLMEASAHGSGEPDYLVWSEFGVDFVDELKHADFTPTIYFQNTSNLKDPSQVFVARKSASSDKKTLHVENPYAEESSKTVANATVVAPWEFVPEIQAQRIALLTHKLLLTAQHAHNVEAIIGEKEQQIEKLKIDSTYFEQQLQAILQSRSWRAVQKLARIQRIIPAKRHKSKQ